MSDKKLSTKLIFILDRSGSMGGLESDTIGGFNALLHKNKQLSDPCEITTILFDHEYEVLHDDLPISSVNDITSEDYFVRGSTALLDAIGLTIAHLSEKVSEKQSVMMVITTDGMENASRLYTQPMIKDLIESKTAKGWEFLFLGANIDAVETASSFGIAPERAQNYHADKIGTEVSFLALASTSIKFRIDKAISKNWSESIESDFESRSDESSGNES
jgi:hypothetical protein